jgi:tRNA (mo5U34)-methyltransferase
MITQAEIDRLRWFHDFDFPNGLHARSAEADTVVFRRIHQWFLTEHLRSIGVAGKRVLDVGCWDGYYSFLAEELGAGRVLAVDDASQNWGSTVCFEVAKTLKQSNVERRPDVSVYHLSERVRDTFDVVLCFGVYYHLHAPYNGLAQIRAVCHDDSVVLIEGDCIRDDDRAYAEFDYRDARRPTFVPTTALLRDMLRSCYFDVERMAFTADVGMSQMLALVPPAELLRLVARHQRDRRAAAGRHPLDQPAALRQRVLIVARPFRGRNPVHKYPPPFGLARFDEPGAFEPGRLTGPKRAGGAGPA